MLDTPTDIQGQPWRVGVSGKEMNKARNQDYLNVAVGTSEALPP